MKLLFSLACAAAIVAAPASAADLLGSAPPLSLPATQGPLAFEVGSSWYVRGDLGISFDRAPNVSFSNIALPTLGPIGAPFTIGNGANWTTTNFTGGAGFGYRWNDWLRFDATWDYRNGPGGSRQAAVVCPYGLAGVSGPTGAPLGFLYDTTNTCNGSASVRQFDNAFLGNAYLDLGTYYGFTPYVGGGLGLNMNTLTGNASYNETANGQPYAANLTAIAAISAGVGQHAGAGAGAATQRDLRAAILEPLDPYDKLVDGLGARRRSWLQDHPQHDARHRLSLPEQRHGQYAHQSADGRDHSPDQCVAADPRWRPLLYSIDRDRRCFRVRVESRGASFRRQLGGKRKRPR